MKDIKQFVKFCVVGTSNASVSLLVYYGCLFWGVNYVLANIISWVAGVTNSFYWNNKYVFSVAEEWWKALLKSYLSYGFSLVSGTFLLSFLVEVVDISVILAPIIVMAIMIPINFFLNKKWVFGRVD